MSALYPNTERSHVTLSAAMLARMGKAAAGVGAGGGVAKVVGLVEPLQYDFQTEYEIVEQLEISLAAEASEKERMDRQYLALQAAREEEFKLQEFLRKEEQAKKEQEDADKKLIERLKLEEAVADLTPAQRDSAFEFQSVAGCSDMAVTKKYLIAYKWDFSSAVSAFFEFGGDVSKLPKVEDPKPSIPSVGRPPSAGKAPDSKVNIVMVLPDTSKVRKDFAPADTLWDVYSYLTTESHKWGTKPFMIGNIDRLFKEEELDMTIKDHKIGDGSMLFVKVIGAPEPAKPSPKPVIPDEPIPKSPASLIPLVLVLPDLSRLKKEFALSSTLWDVYSYLTTESRRWDGKAFMIGNSEGLYKESDLDKTLKDLGLVPNTSIFVKKF